MPLSFEIIPNESFALKLVYAWRNDPIIRNSSFHQKPKQFDSFCRSFFEEHHQIPCLPPLFIQYDRERVGVLTFKPATQLNRCLISIFLNPEKRFKKIAYHALKSYLPQLPKIGFTEILAQVLKTNEPAKKLFESLGFVKQFEALKPISDEGTQIPYISYLYQSNPSQVYVIAEVGSNWKCGDKERDMQQAKTLIETAAEAGANAVKFQLYTAEEVYTHNAGYADYLKNSKDFRSIEEIFNDYAMPIHFIEELVNYARLQGIDWMVSTFSPKSLIKMDPYVKKHKIASYEINHYPLLSAAAKTGKPLILSTGASTLEEISSAIKHFYKEGGTSLILMQCTAKYPAPIESLALKTLTYFKETYNCTIGLSDHSLHPTLAPLLAIGLGATYIEKHFTLSRKLTGPDHFFSLEPVELAEMIQQIRLAEKALGSENKKIEKAESELRLFAKRFLHACRDLHPGDRIIYGDNVELLRPGKQNPGLSPEWLEKIQGQVVCRSIKRGHGIQKEDITWKVEH